jgi:hypothetical protein
MWRIYNSARQVLAWLGEESDDSSDAILLVKKIHEFMINSLSSDPVILTPQLLSELGFDASTKNWKAFWDLLKRHYWYRIWIIQESYFAGEVDGENDDRCIIGCGRQWLPRKCFTHANMFIQLLNRTPEAFAIDMHTFPGNTSQFREPMLSINKNLDLSGIHMFELLYFAQRKIDGGPPPNSLSQHLLMSKDFRYTDPKDRVFALTGMLSKNGPPFPLDYSRSLQQIVADAVEFAITEDQDLSVLHGNRRESYEGMPTWAPYGNSLLLSGIS